MLASKPVLQDISGYRGIDFSPVFKSACLFHLNLKIVGLFIPNFLITIIH